MSHGFIPTVEYLADLPVATAAGHCMVHDGNGSAEDRYIFYFPFVGGAVVPYRYDIWNNTWQAGTGIAVPVGSVLDGSAAAEYDPSRNVIYLIWPMSVAPWLYMVSYNVSTGLTAALDTATLGLVAQWGTSSALFHPCAQFMPDSTTSQTFPAGALAVAATPLALDDSVFLLGNNVVTLYVYSIANNTWTTIVPVGGARTAAPGAGTTLHFLPGTTTGDLFSVRGGGSTRIDRFRMSTAAWSQLTIAQGVSETYDLGTCGVFDQLCTPEKVVYYRNATMQLRALSTSGQTPTGGFTPVGTAVNKLEPWGTYLGVDGVAHAGQLLTVVRDASGQVWYYFAVHTGQRFMRVLRGY